MESQKKKTSMSVPEMGKMLGLKKTESYYLIRKNYFKVVTVGRSMRVMIDSFEEWYGNQSWYKKVDGTPPGELIKETTLSAAEIGEILGLSEAYTYELLAREQEHFVIVPVLGKKRITKESFERWYAGQSFYRTKEDRELLAEQNANTYSFPEIARMLGVHRNNVYHITNKKIFEVVKVGNQKRVTKESFEKWYEGQERYILVDNTQETKGRDL